MSLVENVTTFPEPRAGNYESRRSNALRHGVLSQHTVMPWEDGQEYSTLLEALDAPPRTRLEGTNEHRAEFCMSPSVTPSSASQLAFTAVSTYANVE